MPSQEELHKLYTYNKETGELRFKIDRRPIRKAGDIVGSEWGLGYRTTTINSVTLKVHRIIWTMCNGPIPKGLTIDHIDHNPANNKIDNLRLATQAQQTRNAKKKRNNTSGITGVKWGPETNKWVAYIANKTLGRYESFEKAVAVRQQAERDFGFSETHGR